MKTALKFLAGALLALGLVACSTYPAAFSHSGNPKFTTGLSAPPTTPPR
jgi:hypothetical protein